MDQSLQFKLKLYENQPNFFNDDELDLLKTQLSEAGVDKAVIDNMGHATNGRDSSFSLGRSIANFLEGTVEGATTLNLGVTEPKNTADTIARSLGNLGGFVGTAFTPIKPLAMGLGAAAKGAKALNLTKTASKLSGSKKAIESSQFLKKIGLIDNADNLKWGVGIPSVPKYASEKFMSGALGIKGFDQRAKELGKSYAWLQKGTKSQGIIHDAINLGVMSAASTLTVNPFSWYDNFIPAIKSAGHGAVAGAGFGAIGNIRIAKALTNNSEGVRKGAEATVKGLAGMATQGIIMNASLPDDYEMPLGEEVYEYMLGAYFGANSASPTKRVFEGPGGARERVDKAIFKDKTLDSVLKDQSYNKEVTDMTTNYYNSKVSSEKNIADFVHARMRGDLDFSLDGFMDVRVTAKNKYTGKRGKLLIDKPRKDGKHAVDIEGKTVYLKNTSFEFKKADQTEKYFQNGDALSKRENRTNSRAFHNLEDFVFHNETALASNAENAVNNITRTLNRNGQNVSKTIIREKIGEILSYKTARQADEAIFEIMTLPEIQKAPSGVRESFKTDIRKHLHAKDGTKEINQLFLHEGLETGNQAIVTAAPHVNNVGAVVPPRANTRTTWERSNFLKGENNTYLQGPLPEVSNFKYYEINTRQGFKTKKNGKVQGYVKGSFYQDNNSFNNSNWKTREDQFDKTKLTKKEKQEVSNIFKSRNEYIKINHALIKQGLFPLGGAGGSKDRSVATELQFDSTPQKNSINKPRDYILEQSKGNPELNRSLNKMREDYIGYLRAGEKDKSFGWKPEANELAPFNNSIRQYAKYQYENMVASKMKWLEQVNGGISFKEMTEANKIANARGLEKPFIDNLIDLNKRLPLINSMESKWIKEDFQQRIPDLQGDAFAISLVKNSSPKIKSKVLNGKELDNHYDGVYTLRQDVFDAASRSFGLKEDIVSSKGTLYDISPGKGALLGKYQYKRANKADSEAMMEASIHGELDYSGIKQLGNRKVYNVNLENGKDVYSRNGKKVDIQETIQLIPIESHKMNIGPAENVKKQNQNQTSALQNWEWLFTPYINKSKITKDGKEVPFDHVDVFKEFENVTKDSFNGKKEINDIVVSKQITAEQLAKLKESNINDISLENVINIATNPSSNKEIYKAVWKKILKEHQDLNNFLSDDVIDANAMQTVSEVIQGKSTADRINIFSDQSPGSVNHKWSKNYNDMVLRRYLLNKINKPVEKESQKLIGLPYTRRMQADFKINPGEVYIHRDAAKKIVEFEGKEISIAELVKQRDNLEKRKDKGSKQKLDAINDKLDVVVLRVPADNISGQRVVKIKGILNERGTGIVLHPEDMHFLGGMDLDIDSVFMYHGRSKGFKEAIRKNKDIMGGSFEATSSRSRFIDREGINNVSPADLLTKNAYMFDPLMSDAVSRNAYVNNQNLGIAISDGQNLGRAIDIIQKKPGHVFKVRFNEDLNSNRVLKKGTGGEKDLTLKEFMEKDGSEVTMSIKKEHSFNDFSKLITEATNMYADAGKFGKLVGKEKLLNEMWKASGINIRLKNGASIPLEWQKEIFKGTIFGSTNTLKKSFKGNSYENGEKVKLSIERIKEESNNFIERLQEEGLSEFMPGSLQSKASRLSNIEKIDTAFLYNVDPIKYPELIRKTKKRIEEIYSDLNIQNALKGYENANVPKDKLAISNPNKYRDFISNDLDFVTTSIKMEKTFNKVKNIVGEKNSQDVIKKIMDYTFEAAAENQVLWQKEKHSMYQERLQKDRRKQKEFTSHGGKTLIDGVRASIQESSQDFLRLFRDSKTLTEKQQRQLGEIAQDTFYHALSSNIVLGKNAIKEFIAKESIPEQNVNQAKGEANLDLLYTLDVIPPKYLKEHFNIREKVETAIEKTSKYGSQDPVDLILADKPIPEQKSVIDPEIKQRREQRQEAKEIIRGYRDGLAKEKLYKEIEKKLPNADKETKKMVNDLETIFHARPDVLEYFDQVFPAVTARPIAATIGKAEIGVELKNATKKDIDSFIKFFKRPMTEDQFRRWGRGESIENPLKKGAYWQFPETLVDKNAPFDITLVPKKGLIFKETPEGTKIVEVDLKKPMSKIETLTDSNRVMTERKTALTDQYGNLMERELGYLKGLDSQMAKSIEEAAIGKIESKRLKYESKLARPETYQEGEKFYKDFVEKFGKEKRSILVNGDSKSISIKEITDMTAQKVEKMLKDIYDNVVRQDTLPFHSKDGGQQFLVNKDGFPNIELTVNQRMNSVIGSAKQAENITDKGFKMSPGLTNDSIMKTLELAKRYDQVVTHKGKSVLLRDLKTLDPKRLATYLYGNTKKEGILAEIEKRHGIGVINEGYFPHMGHPEAIVKEYVRGRMKNKSGNTERSMEEMTRAELSYLGRERADGGGMMEYQNFILNQGYADPKVKSMSAQRLTQNMKGRSADLPYYLKNINVLNKYATQAFNLRYNAMMALSNHVTIKNFDNSRNLNGTPLMGNAKNQEHWGRFLRLLSLKDSGGSHVLPEQWLADKSFNISKVYKNLTEGELFKTAKKVGKFFGNENMLLAKDLNGDYTIAANSARLNHLANLEAKIATSTLLFNTRGVTYNITGGSVNTIINAGFDNFIKSYDYNYLRKVIPDPNYKKGTTDDRGRDWFINEAKKHGVIETFWTNELAGNPTIRSLRVGNLLGGKDGGEVFSKGLYRDLMDAGPLNKNKRKDRRTMREVLSEYGVDAKLADLGGWFMKTAEVELRLRGFLANYLKAREVFDSQGKHFKADDPFLIDMALRGVTGTQYLYNNTGRPMVTASPIGRVFSRFQLWTANSLRMRKDIFRMARDAGFKEGTEEHKKYQRMLTADMFMFGLAAMLPYSMFDATLPPPYNYYQEMSAVMYGEPQEKERAFFGALPYPLNVTGLITPPAGRYITQPLGNMMTGEWDRFWDYQVYSWFPGGMVVKTAKDVLNEPIKAVDKITGFPLYRLNYMSKDNEEEEK